MLDEHGTRAGICELQGDLRFSTIEPALRDIFEADTTVRLTNEFAALES